MNMPQALAVMAEIQARAATCTHPNGLTNVWPRRGEPFKACFHCGTKTPMTAQEFKDAIAK